MKKLILTSILSSIFVASAFSFDNANDSGQLDNTLTNMSNTVPRAANVSQKSMPHDSVRNMQSHRPIINQINKQQAPQIAKRHLGSISEENLQASRVTRKYHKQNPANNKPNKETDKSKNDSKNIDKNKEDENLNLDNLTTPAPKNIKDNLRISDEDKSLNRQMMMDGPQEGFQNNQPRGIGGTSTNFYA